MKIKLFITLCLLLPAFLTSNKLQAQTWVDYQKQGFLVAPLTYVLDGETIKGHILCLPFRRFEEPALVTNHLYFLKSTGENYILGTPEEFLTGIYGMKISPDNSFIAFEKSGEGHPWVEIYSLEQLLVNNSIDLVAEINPYPGSINVIEWQGNALVFESDVDFTALNPESSRELSETQTEVMHRYAFEVIEMMFVKLW